MINRIIFQRVFVLFYLVFSPSFISSQSQIDELITKIKSGVYSYGDLSIITDNNSLTFIDELESILTQLDRNQRLTSYQFVHALVSDSFDNLRKERFISYVVRNGFNDPDIGNRQSVVDMSYLYEPSYLTPSLLNFLSGRVISKDEPHLSLIRLSGWFKIRQLENFVRQQLTVANDFKSQWTYHLFLGRMGDPNSVQYCIETIRKIGLNDDVVYHLIPDLVYLHQNEAIDFILTKILDDEELCTSPNPDYDVAITCAYRLMELVAPVIEGFPLRTGPSGDLEVDDYPTGLEQVRQWIVAHFNSYELKRQ